MPTQKDSSLAERLREDLHNLARAARARVITHDEAARALAMSPRQATVRIYSLVGSGWLHRIRRGLYLVQALEAPPTAPLTLEASSVIAISLFSPCYVGGWTAAEHWGLARHRGRSIFVASGGRVRQRSLVIDGTEYHVVKVPPARAAGVRPVWRGRQLVPISDQERTIADGLVSPAWLGGARRLARVLEEASRGEHWNPERLLREVRAARSGAAFKRLGYIAQELHLPELELVDEARAHRTAGIVRLDPAIPARGRITKYWGLQINATLAPARPPLPDEDDEPSAIDAPPWE